MMRPGTTLFTLLCVCLCAPLPAAAQSGDGRSQSNSAPVIASPVLPRPRPAQQPHPTDIDRVTADKPVVDHDAGNNNGNDDGNNDGKAARPPAIQSRQSELGWETLTDEATGVRIRLPMKIVPIVETLRDGTRWHSRYGNIQIETFRIRSGLSLAALFELEKRKPRPRRTEHSVLHDDSFIISGMQGLRIFAMRAFAKGGELRGYTIQFDQALNGIVAPIAAAMADVFTAFPSDAFALASIPSKIVDYGSGVVVSSLGHIVTERRLTDNCQVIVAAGLGPAEPVASDGQMTLLRVFGARGLKAVSLADAVPTGEATLRGVPEPRTDNGNGEVRTLAVRINDNTSVQPLPENGYTGGGIFDREGRLAGLLVQRPTIVANAEGAVTASATLLPVEALRAFLGEHQVTPAAATPGDPRASIVRIICVRK